MDVIIECCWEDWRSVWRKWTRRRKQWMDYCCDGRTMADWKPDGRSECGWRGCVVCEFEQWRINGRMVCDDYGKQAECERRIMWRTDWRMWR